MEDKSAFRGFGSGVLYWCKCKLQVHINAGETRDDEDDIQIIKNQKLTNNIKRFTKENHK